MGIQNSNTKKRRRYFYCLTFQVEFEYQDDSVYFAYSTPYTYSQMYLELLRKESHLVETAPQTEDLKVVSNPEQFMKQIQTRDIQYERRMLCRSVSGLPLPVITVTSKRNKGLEYRKRQAICFTCRVHPGETNSNFVLDGFLNSLLDYQ